MIKKITHLFFLIAILLNANIATAQIISINDPANDSANNESKQSLESLIRTVLISGPCAQIDDFSEQVFGNDDDVNTKSYGYFKRHPGSRFPFKEGVILTSGNAFQAGNTIGPTGVYPSNANGLAGDGDLQNALGIPVTNDATWIKFKFTPQSSDISFRFIMASEEYDQSTECNFADGFAFLLREAGTTTYTNLAVLPDGTPVSVTNINNAPACGANQTYFDGYDLGDTNYGGQTVVLTASSPVTPNVEYEIKLVVADAVDSVWDSAIFLEAGSFVLSADLGDPQVAADNNAVCGPTKLLDAGVPAQSFQWYFDDGSGFNPIGGAINQAYNANLGNGTYKVEATFAAGCVAEDEVYLEFVDLPIATKPIDMILCDDDNDGSMVFNLRDQELDILNGQPTSDFEVLYFRDVMFTDEITGTDINNFTSTGQKIYAKVRNLNSTNCGADTDFDLIIHESAFPAIPTDIPLLGDCDNTSVGTDTDGFIKFDLHDRESDILNGQSSTNFTLTYFLDATYTTQIPVADETNFTNTIAGGQPIYVRMTNNATASLTTICYTDTEFQIEVFELPVLNTPPFVLEQCDDDFDGVNAFNLFEINTDIITNITTEVFTFYESLADAEGGDPADAIPNPTTYRNDDNPNIDNTIWARAENANGCYRTTQITLIVKPSAIPPTFIRTFYECDDGTDDRDGVATFDFSSVTAEVQALFPTAIDVFYYRNQADATAEVNEITDPSNYENIGYQDMQEIWVRADSQLGNDCLGNGHHITLIVEELPVANKPTDLTECDDDQDGIYPFDTSNVENEILNGQSLTDITITYYNEDGSLIGNVLPNPFATTSQTIDIVLTNNVTNDPDGACSEATTLIFTVDTLPINNVQPLFTECETDPDDGMLIATFDTSALETSIGAQTGMDITYLNSNGTQLQDMDGNPIASPFPNTITTVSQIITVIVTNPLNTTCPQTKTVEFVVNPRPIFDLMTDDLVCENILPHSITVENPDANNYKYNWYNSLGVSVGNDQTLTFLTDTDITDLTQDGVDYTVTVTNLTTSCERSKTINLRKSSIATLTEDDIITTEFSSPGNSIEIITTTLGSGDYEFALDHPSDSKPYQDEPIFEDLLGGIYIVKVRDKNDCGEATLEVVLLDYPKFLTPNNDGYNDIWQLIGLGSTTFTISPIQIYDRFGKIIAIINPIPGEGWDGLYNNEVLPSSEYWFSLELTDNQGNIKRHRGHFTLVRR